jgi:hypothetical protein
MKSRMERSTERKEEARRRGSTEAARLREEREEVRRKEMRDLQEQELQIQRDQWGMAKIALIYVIARSSKRLQRKSNSLAAC